jgi:hypothetical protein
VYQKYLRFALAAAAAWLLSTSITHAQTIAYDVQVQPGNQNWQGNLGLDFNVNAGHPIVVSTLGAFDNNGDGFAGTVNVAIFDRNTTAQVGPAATFTGTTGTLVNGNRFLAVTPFVLPPGNYSVVAVGFSNTDANGNTSLPASSLIPSTENTGGLISFVGTGRYDSNTSLDFPAIVPAATPSNVFLAGTFQFTAAAVPPILTKTFAVGSIGVGDTTALTFSLTSPNTPLTGLGFTDTLPSGLQVAAPNGLTGSCGGGTTTATAGSNSISVSGTTLGSGASCTFSVNVTAITEGTQNNTTSTVTDNEGLTGAPASASLEVISSSLFFLWFFHS